MRIHNVFPALLVGCLPVAVLAATVPITVRVDGDPVQSIELDGETGLVPLIKEENGARFTGTMEVGASGVVIQPLIIRYPDFRYPISLTLHPYLKFVAFPVELKPATSCTRRRVETVELEVTTLPDAINNSLLSTRLANIQGNDRCLGTLRSRVIRAKFRNTRRMAQLSNGRFVVPHALIAEYQQTLSTSQSATAEVERYKTEALELQATQLVAARGEAQSAGRFATAAAIQQVIAKVANSKAEAREAFANVGLSEKRIAADSAFLSTKADQELAAERDN